MSEINIGANALIKSWDSSRIGVVPDANARFTVEQIDVSDEFARRLGWPNKQGAMRRGVYVPIVFHLREDSTSKEKTIEGGVYLKLEPPKADGGERCWIGTLNIPIEIASIEMELSNLSDSEQTGLIWTRGSVR